MRKVILKLEVIADVRDGKRLAEAIIDALKADLDDGWIDEEYINDSILHQCEVKTGD